MTSLSLLAASGNLDALKWRCIGPPRGGRVVAVAGDPVDAMVFYFGACAGGIWKTIDGGIYWRCVSDGFLDSAAIGAIAVARSDHNVIYAGTGETEIRLAIPLVLLASVAGSVANSEKNSARLVSFAELERRLGEADLRVLDARPRPDYDQGHIPGAVWVDAKAAAAFIAVCSRSKPVLKGVRNSWA